MSIQDHFHPPPAAAPGELILSFSRRDVAAEMLLGWVGDTDRGDVRLTGTMSGRLRRLNLSLSDDQPLDAALVSVAPGSEVAMLNEIYQRYLELRSSADDSPPSLLIGFNTRLEVAATCARSFSRSPHATPYLEMLGVKGPNQPVDTAGTSIAILDTGIDLCGYFNIAKAVSFVSGAPDATDDSGHGTAVSAVIADLAPNSDMYVAKVADSNNHASEWDLLAGLGFATTDLVNLSLAFPLSDVDCPYCGTHSHSSRSIVLERSLNYMWDSAAQPIIVAAAGNAGRNALAYPARFGKVIAVSSVTSTGELSSFSNYGTAAADGSPHENRFTLPGGQKGPAEEWVVDDTATGRRYDGTSFSAAYASGLLLNVLAEARRSGTTERATILAHVRGAAERLIPAYSEDTHGNGIMQLSYLP